MSGVLIGTSGWTYDGWRGRSIPRTCPGGRYKDNYSDKTLRGWARDINRWTHEGRSVFVYFDNDQKSAAPQDAKRLMRLLGQPKLRLPCREARARIAS